MPRITRRLHVILLPAALMLAACGASEEPASQASAAAQPSAPAPGAPQGCADEAGIRYLCGPINAEDILQLGDSEWLLVSGMNGELSGSDQNGNLYLVNHRDKEFRAFFPGDAPILRHDTASYPDCPGPLDTTNFSGHGLALQAQAGGPARFRLYMTSHGAREAVEIFEIDAFLEPTIRWIGCVPMPATSWTNSVAILEDGGFLATQFMDPTGSGMAGVIAREITGHVFEWHPGGEVEVVAGTELSGPNGIAVSDDGRYVFVAAFGTHEVLRFDRSSTPPEKESVVLDIAPDNVRWTSRGTLITAGGVITDSCAGPVCGEGWAVVEIVPYDLSAVRIAGMAAGAALQGVSTALPVGGEIWVGTYGGDRIGILPVE